MVESAPRRIKVLIAAVVLVVLAGVAWVALTDQPSEPSQADWRLAAEAQVLPTSRTIPIVVNENECASGRSAEGRIVADVTYENASVEIDIGVRPLGGDQDCQGNPDTPFVVELDQPLGDRTILGQTARAPETPVSAETIVEALGCAELGALHWSSVVDYSCDLANRSVGLHLVDQSSRAFVVNYLSLRHVPGPGVSTQCSDGGFPTYVVIEGQDWVAVAVDQPTAEAFIDRFGGRGVPVSENAGPPASYVLHEPCRGR